MTRRLILALALTATLAAGPRAARADNYQLDASHTSIIFGISHLGLSLTYGRFNEMSGAYTLDAADPAASKFEFAIKADSVDTNNAQRDNHLKSADFLNAGEFPVISFTSTKVAVAEEDGKTVYEVTGDMTMHGVTKEVTLKLVKLGEGPGPGGRGYRSGFLCDTHLLRSDFGMTGGIPDIGDEVAITISFEGVRDDGAGQ
jgi:polyisoprenoid-binding protein YceI